MKIHIKHMVSSRCKMFVENELTKLGLHCTNVALGEIDVKEEITRDQLIALKTSLDEGGLDLLADKKEILVEKIKIIIVEMFNYADYNPSQLNFSECLKQKLQYDYTYLANLFSQTTGITIEHYIIAHKIESIKSLLSYGELNLNEISYKLNYRSVAHLSNQFKQNTGHTPSFYKAYITKKRAV